MKVRASHILVQTEEEAKDLYEQIILYALQKEMAEIYVSLAEE